jgi:hypothetical protein
MKNKDFDDAKVSGVRYQTILNYITTARRLLNKGEIEMLDLCLSQLLAEAGQLYKWETPEQREKRTGYRWPANAAVYSLYEETPVCSRFWFCESLYDAREGNIKGANPVCIICATEAGPPPDDWKPEEG